MTRDTVNPSGPGTQGYNGYVYATNNPVTLTDPSGHVAIGGLAGMGQGVAGIFA